MKNRKKHLEWNSVLNPPVDFDVTMVRVALKDEGQKGGTKLMLMMTYSA
jgi:hypothetical protein